MPKSVPDFKRRTAKVGRKLAPANESRIEVKFGTLDAVRRPVSPASSAPAVAASQLRDALAHVGHHSEGQRLTALQQVRGLLASAPAAVRAGAGEALSALAARLADDAPPVRGAAAALLAAVVADLPRGAAAALLPLVTSHVCAALARPHAGTRLDAVGALGALWAAAPRALHGERARLLPALVGLLEPQLHAAGAVPSLAAATPPPCFALALAGGGGGGGGAGGGGGGGGAAGALPRARAGGRETRLAIVYVLRRALLDGDDASCEEGGGGLGGGGEEEEGGGDGEGAAGAEEERDQEEGEEEEGGGKGDRESVGGGPLFWEEGDACAPPAPCALFSAAATLAPACAAGAAAPGGGARLPLPLAVEGLAQVVGLWLEYAPSDAAAAAPPAALHALALCAHAAALLLREGGVVRAAYGAGVGEGGAGAAAAGLGASCHGGDAGGASLRALFAALRGGGGAEGGGVHLARLALRAVAFHVAAAFPFGAPLEPLGGAVSSVTPAATSLPGPLQSPRQGSAPPSLPRALLNARLAQLAVALLPPPEALPLLLAAPAPAPGASGEGAAAARKRAREGKGGAGAPATPSHRAAAAHGRRLAEMSAFLGALLSPAAGARAAGALEPLQPLALHLLRALLGHVGVACGCGGGAAAEAQLALLRAPLEGAAALLATAGAGSPLQGAALRFACAALRPRHRALLPSAVVEHTLAALPRLVWGLGARHPAPAFAALRLLAAEARACAPGSPAAAAAAAAGRLLAPLFYTTAGPGGGPGGSAAPRALVYGPFLEYPPAVARAAVAAVRACGALTPALLRAGAVVARCPRAPLRARALLVGALTDALLEAEAAHAAACGGARGGALLPPAAAARSAPGDAHSAFDAAAARAPLDPSAAGAAAFLLSVALGRAVWVSAHLRASQLSPGAPAASDRGCGGDGGGGASARGGTALGLELEGLSEGDAHAMHVALALAAGGLRRVAGAAVGGPPALRHAVSRFFCEALWGFEGRAALTGAFVGGAHAPHPWDAAALATLALCVASPAAGGAEGGGAAGEALAVALVAMLLGGRGEDAARHAPPPPPLPPALGPAAPAAAPFFPGHAAANARAAGAWLRSAALAPLTAWVLGAAGEALRGAGAGAAGAAEVVAALMGGDGAPPPAGEGLRGACEACERAARAAGDGALAARAAAAAAAVAAAHARLAYA
jgi:hypothetical protein